MKGFRRTKATWKQEKGGRKKKKCENAMLGSNNVSLTASLVVRLSLGVSSD